MRNPSNLFQFAFVGLALVTACPAQADPKSEYAKMVTLLDTYIAGKHYAKEADFLQNKKAVQSKLDTFAKNVLALEKINSPLVKNMDLMNLFASVLDAKVLIGGGASAVEQFAFSFDEVMVYPWKAGELNYFLTSYGRRHMPLDVVADLHLGSYVTKNAEAQLIVRYLDRWGWYHFDSVKRDINKFGVQFIQFDTANPAVFEKVSAAIRNTQSGDPFWIWAYVRGDDLTYYSEQYKTCALLLNDWKPNKYNSRMD